MYCSGHFRVLLLFAAILLSGWAIAFPVFAQDTPGNAQDTQVHLRWGPQAGVARYRLQLATDSSFADILFDRVVSGNEYEVEGLDPGRYFWRVAPLTKRLGDFSSAGVIDVSKTAPAPLPQGQSGNDPTRIKTANSVVARGGWRAAVGDMAHPLLAHLRSRDKPDIVGMNSQGVIFALDAGSGIAIWSTGRRTSKSRVVAPGSAMVVLLPSRSGMDNVVALSASSVVVVEGSTGRELWRTTLPATAVNATVVSDGRSQAILLIDNSLQRLLTLDAVNGNLLAQIKLPHRVVGTPVLLSGQGAQGSGQIVLAYDSGQVEIRNMKGAVVRSGDAGSPATTPPLFIKGRGSDFILVGTRGGLTALTSSDLYPLGMVAIKEDTPRGTLAAEDLDGDGSAEVIMMTARGRLIAVSGADGKTIWEATVGNDAQSVAFADVDADRVLDVIVTGGQSFALALSGKDGSVIWKDGELPGVVANHSVALAPRSILSMRYGSGALLIASDPSGNGLRALEFPKGTAPSH
jgi:outer membrane protein assembly factor BamB